MGEDLPEILMHHVLEKVLAQDCARWACVDRQWRRVTADDALWRWFCLRDFAVSSLHDPTGYTCLSFKETYIAWRNWCGQCPFHLVARAKRCWDALKDWLCENFVEVLETLSPGSSWEDIEEAEAQLGLRLPEPMRILYHVCGGQELPLTSHGISLGLLGGYCFYDHFVNVRLLHLQGMVRETLYHKLYRLDAPALTKKIVIASSSGSRKDFFLDCVDGCVYVAGEGEELILCAPKLQQEGTMHQQDGVLRWLENYVNCLQSGKFKVQIEDGRRSISLYPTTFPYRTEAITRGVQVRCSAVFVPELSGTTIDGHFCYSFSYSVCMALLASSEQDGSALEHTHLWSRHWVIRADDQEFHTRGQESHTRGLGVIGQHPYLVAGGECFVYHSSCDLWARSGSMEGEYIFKPGSINLNEGPEFVVRIARFPLEMPQYIY